MAEKQQDVDQEHKPDAFAEESRPAPVVFELADHLQQLVRVVVYPSRGGGTATDPRLLATLVRLEAVL